MDKHSKQAYQAKNLSNQYCISRIQILGLLLLVAGLMFHSYSLHAAGSSVRFTTSPQRQILEAALDERTSLRATDQRAAYLNLDQGRDLLTTYSGEERLRQALEEDRARPLSLGSADFDEDGAQDLIGGYAGPHGGGIVTLHRGDVDFIYENAAVGRRRKAENESIAAPYLSPALVFGLPEAADFIGAGDFDGDGHRDVLAAARGSSILHLLSGDGRAGFSQLESLDLGAAVTALVTGDVNRRDGLEDLVVAVSGGDGPKALVFEAIRGALRARPEVFALPAEAASLALGQLDGDYSLDIAIAAGRELMIIYGRDRKLWQSGFAPAQSPQPEVETRSLPFTVQSLATGNFTQSHRSDIALLSDDGQVCLLNRGDAKVGLEDWKMAIISSRNAAQAGRLVSARTSSLPLDDLVLIDSNSRLMHIFTDVDQASGNDQTAKALTATQQSTVSSFDLESNPVAALPVRINEDALTDLVILRSNQSRVTIAMTTPAAIITVNSNSDINVRDNFLTFREAILVSNGALGLAALSAAEQAQVSGTPASPGLDEIRFNIGGGGAQTIALRSSLPTVTDAVTIDGYTQPGSRPNSLPGSNNAILHIELNGAGAGQDASGLRLTSGSNTIRGLVINRFAIDGISLIASSDNIIEGNFLGTDLAGTADRGNIRGLALETGSSNNVIGGTSPQSRNVVSGNDAQGIRIFGNNLLMNKVQGNFIGTDLTGTVRLSNTFEGLLLHGNTNNRVEGNTVGGTEPGARNVISGNGPGLQPNLDSPGLALTAPGATGNLVQGNFIGPDASGTRAVGNFAEGLLINVGASSNTIGGASEAARNIISGNGKRGISIGFDLPVSLNVIQGNYIGTAVNGIDPLGNGTNPQANSPCGIFVNLFSNNNTIRDNKIAFNAGGGICLPNDPSGRNNHCIRIKIESNSIYSNAGLGIDLGDAGVTANDPGNPSAGVPPDADIGANDLQNFPTLTSAAIINTGASAGRDLDASAGSGIRIMGELKSTPNTDFYVQFFYNAQCSGYDPAVSQQALNFIPLLVHTDSSGAVAIDVTLPDVPPSSGFVNATATSVGGNTSEFSQCIAIENLAPTGPSVISAIKNNKKLIVEGSNFDSGAKIFVNGEEQKTTYDSAAKLIGKKAGKKIKSGDKVKVKNGDRSESNEYTYP